MTERNGGLMEDMISRQALCEYALNQKDKSITPNDIMRFPSAQPETHEKRTETHACDLIDRQAAIDALDKRFDSIPIEQTTEILLLRKDLRELPSAQPDSKETSSTHKALDTISRQAALNALSRGSGCGASCHRAIKALPSAQPETHDKRTETHACDCISRQAVIEINRSYHGQMPNEVNHRIWKEINKLPSADLSGYSDKLWKAAYERGRTEAQQRWIPCSERLPEKEEQVLIYAWNVHYVLAKYREIRICDGVYKMAWVTEDAYSAPREIKHEVICWMPLPEPYAERRTDEQDSE